MLEYSTLFSREGREELSRGVEILADSSIKRVAIANPKTAPYGLASVNALKRVGIYGGVSNKFIFGENISSTFNYALKATDVGIVAKSLLLSPKLKGRFKEGVNWVELNSSIYEPIKQGTVILKEGAGDRDVALLFSFLFSREAQEIFKRFGYLN